MVDSVIHIIYGWHAESQANGHDPLRPMGVRRLERTVMRKSLFSRVSATGRLVKDVELLRSKGTFNTCGCDMSGCAEPKLKDAFR